MDVAPPADAQARAVADVLLDSIRGHTPDAVADIEPWVRQLRWAILEDRAQPRVLAEAARFAHAWRDPFWRIRVRSGRSLRLHAASVHEQRGTAPAAERGAAVIECPRCALIVAGPGEEVPIRCVHGEVWATGVRWTCAWCRSKIMTMRGGVRCQHCAEGAEPAEVLAAIEQLRLQHGRAED